MSFEIGVEWNIIHSVDASACNGIMIRQGAGNVKHLSTRQLWIEDILRKLKIIVKKISRDDIMADLLARRCNSKDLSAHLIQLNFGPKEVEGYTEISSSGKMEISPSGKTENSSSGKTENRNQ